MFRRSSAVATSRKGPFATGLRTPRFDYLHAGISPPHMLTRQLQDFACIGAATRTYASTPCLAIVLEHHDERGGLWQQSLTVDTSSLSIPILDRLGQPLRLQIAISRLRRQLIELVARDRYPLHGFPLCHAACPLLFAAQPGHGPRCSRLNQCCSRANRKNFRANAPGGSMSRVPRVKRRC